MAEIRSTIDIVMERTKNMIQTPEERAAARTAELEKTAMGVLLGLKEARIRPEELVQKINDAGDQKEALQSVLVRTLVQGIELEESAYLVMDGLDELTGGRLAASTDSARRLIGEFLARQEELAGDAVGSVIDDLAAMGITGSALVPKAGQNGELQDDLYRLAAQAEARLQAFKEAMLNS